VDHLFAASVGGGYNPAMNVWSFAIKLVVILVLGSVLLGPDGLRRLASQPVTLTWLLVVVAFVVLTGVRGSNPVLQSMFTWAWLVAALAIVYLYVNFEQDAKAYIVNRLCSMGIGGYEFMRPVCRFFGAR